MICPNPELPVLGACAGVGNVPDRSSPICDCHGVSTMPRASNNPASAWRVPCPKSARFEPRFGAAGSATKFTESSQDGANVRRGRPIRSQFRPQSWGELCQIRHGIGQFREIGECVRPILGSGVGQVGRVSLLRQVRQIFEVVDKHGTTSPKLRPHVAGRRNVG